MMDLTMRESTKMGRRRRRNREKKENRKKWRSVSNTLLTATAAATPTRRQPQPTFWGQRATSLAGYAQQQQQLQQFCLGQGNEVWYT
jgi:hypothetical protein